MFTPRTPEGSCTAEWGIGQVESVNLSRVGCCPVSLPLAVKIDSGDQYSVYTGACTNLQQLLLGFHPVYTSCIFSASGVP